MKVGRDMPVQEIFKKLQGSLPVRERALQQALGSFAVLFCCALLALYCVTPSVQISLPKQEEAW
jgi:hypothetical protein